MGSICAMRATNRVAALMAVIGDPEDLKALVGRTVVVEAVNLQQRELLQRVRQPPPEVQDGRWCGDHEVCAGHAGRVPREWCAGV